MRSRSAQTDRPKKPPALNRVNPMEHSNNSPAFCNQFQRSLAGAASRLTTRRWPLIVMRITDTSGL